MRLALVLSGGGAKGAFEAGVIAAFEEAGLQADILSGTSAGSLNAAGVAVGFDADRLAAIWTSIRDEDVYRVRRDVWRLVHWPGLFSPGRFPDQLLRAVGWTWLWRTDPLRRTLTRILDGERVRVTPGKVLVVPAVEIATGRLLRFASEAPPEHRRDDRWRITSMTVDHLLASSAIPVLFEPGRVGGTPYWDGGVLANTPLGAALAYEPDAAVVVTTATLERPARQPANLAEVAGLLIDTVQRFSLDTALARAKDINALCEAGEDTGGKRALPLLLIDPRGLELGDTLRFDPAQARRLIDLGRRVGAEAIAGWLDQGVLA